MRNGNRRILLRIIQSNVGKRAGVEHYFEIDVIRKHFDTPADFFANVGNKEGGTISYKEWDS